MNKEEIALQLALNAMDVEEFLEFDEDSSLGKQEQIESRNAFNAKQVSDFYNAILAAIQ